MRNYELVIQNLSSFYRQVLNQIITKTLPNGLIIVRAGRSNAGLHELNSLLNLLINAAVSSETKEVYINYIKSFDHAYQAEIAERITATRVTFFSLERMTLSWNVYRSISYLYFVTVRRLQRRTFDTCSFILGLCGGDYGTRSQLLELKND